MPRAPFSFRAPRLTPRRIVALVLLVASLLGGGAFLRGKVVSVADGDTLTVFNAEGRTTKVRLYGIDCPESRQRGGQEAGALTRELALFSEVRLETMDTDRYGRSVAVVYLSDGRILNEELLRQGQAWLYTAYCADPRCLAWKALERTARAEKKGLWQDASPEPPWHWRERHRK